MIARPGVGQIILTAWLSAATSQWALAQTPAGLTMSPRLPQIELRDHDDRIVRLDRVIADRVVIINFFFAGCVTICPPQTAILQQVHDIISQPSDDKGQRPLIVSISIDPSEPPQLRDYAGQFGIRLGENQGWLMLTGGFDDLIRISAAFDDVGNRLQDHSGTIWIGNPKHRRWFRIPYSSPDATSPQSLAALVAEAAK